MDVATRQAALLAAALLETPESPKDFLKRNVGPQVQIGSWVVALRGQSDWQRSVVGAVGNIEPGSDWNNHADKFRKSSIAAEVQVHFCGNFGLGWWHHQIWFPIRWLRLATPEERRAQDEFINSGPWRYRELGQWPKPPRFPV